MTMAIASLGPRASSKRFIHSCLNRSTVGLFYNHRCTVNLHTKLWLDSWGVTNQSCHFWEENVLQCFSATVGKCRVRLPTSWLNLRSTLISSYTWSSHLKPPQPQTPALARGSSSRKKHQLFLGDMDAHRRGLTPAASSLRVGSTHAIHSCIPHRVGLHKCRVSQFGS